MNKQILLIHPYDRTTFFLDKARNFLCSTFPNDIHFYSVKPNEESHKICLKIIENHSEEGLIIFFGHGRSDRLYGARADTVRSQVHFLDDDEEEPYYNGNFITESNCNIFSNKRVFCLACRSNEKIALSASANGANAFLGFGNIPTSSAEFWAEGDDVGSKTIKIMKTEINIIISNSLAYSIKNRCSFNELISIINLFTNKRILNLLIKKKKNKKNLRLIADYLF